MLEYYLPGLDHKKLSDEDFAQKIAHLAFIRKQEAKQRSVNI
jgi:hypothetical protein